MLDASKNILEVSDLLVEFTTDEQQVIVLDHLSFEVEAGKILGIVGESGCGKSVTALSIMRLLPQPTGKIKQGKILLDGIDLLRLSVEEMHHIRGNRIAMIFQEPMTALNPVHRIADQLSEVYQLHFPEMNKKQIRQASVDILKQVGIPAPEQRLKNYPHQLSGGMRQRVMIAMALACKPDILIADEPTTALDVTIQAQILSLLKDLQQQYAMTIIFITHDLGVVANLCDQVIVMYAGKIIEKADVVQLFSRAKHPYTHGLLNSIPRLDGEPKTQLQTIEGIVPDLDELPPGCRFQDRCQHKINICEQTEPPLDRVNNDNATDHKVACIRWRELGL